MNDERTMGGVGRATVVLALATLIVGCAVAISPAAALQADNGGTAATPNTPGNIAEYRVAVVTERGDTITENGLKHVVLDFGADPDFTGNASNVTARDVTVRVEDSATNRTRSVGPISVVADDAGTELLITLDSSYTRIDPGDRVVVQVEGVTNSAIAIDNPQSPRGFALGVAMADTEGDLDGPVEVRYALDPTARASASRTTAPRPATTSTAPSTAATPSTTGTTSRVTTTTGTPTTTAAVTERGGRTATDEDGRTTGDASTVSSPAPAVDSIPVTGIGAGIAVALLALFASALVATRYR